MTNNENKNLEFIVVQHVSVYARNKNILSKTIQLWIE